MPLLMWLGTDYGNIKDLIKEYTTWWYETVIQRFLIKVESFLFESDYALFHQNDIDYIKTTCQKKVHF